MELPCEHVQSVQSSGIGCDRDGLVVKFLDALNSGVVVDRVEFKDLVLSQIPKHNPPIFWNGHQKIFAELQHTPNFILVSLKDLCCVTAVFQVGLELELFEFIVLESVSPLLTELIEELSLLKITIVFFLWLSRVELLRVIGRDL